MLETGDLEHLHGLLFVRAARRTLCSRDISGFYPRLLLSDTNRFETLNVTKRFNFH